MLRSQRGRAGVGPGCPLQLPLGGQPPPLTWVPPLLRLGRGQGSLSVCVVHTGAPGAPGEPWDLGWPWAPVSCPLAGGRAVARARPGLFRVPGWCPRAGAGALLPQGGLACGQHRGQLCPGAWRGPATRGSSCSHRWGTQACRRSLWGHTHMCTRLIMGIHTLSYVSLWVPTHSCLIMGTHTRLLTASRPCPAWTHTQTHTSLRSTDPTSLGLELPFHLGVSPGFRVPAGLRHPLWPCWPAPAPRGQASPWIHHRLASSASSSCLNRFL